MTPVMNSAAGKTGLAGPILISAGRALIYRMTFFFLPLYLIGIGRSGWEVGLLMSLFAVTTLVLALPSGLFNDRVESRKLLAAGFVCLAVFFLGIRTAAGLPLLIVFFLFGGAGASLTQLSIESLVLKGAREGRRGRRFGLYSLVTTLVFAAAAVAGGFLLGARDFRAVFAISGWGALVLAALSPLLGRSRPVFSPVSSYRRDLSGRGKRIFVLILFFFAFHWGAEVTSYTPFLRHKFGFTLGQTGLYMGCALAALAAASWAGGRFSDRLLSIRHAMAAGFLLSGIAQIMMVFPPWGMSFGFRLLHEAGDGMILVLIFFWVSKLFHQDRVSGNYGALTFALLAGQAVSSFIFGPIGAAFGYAAPLWISGIVILLCLALLRRYRHEIFENV